MENNSKAILDDILSRDKGKIGEPTKQWNAMQALTKQLVLEVIMAESNLKAINSCVKRGGKVFYIYTHSRPDGVVFYVGKGVGDRAVDFYQRSDYHKRITAKHGVNNILVAAYEVFNEVHAYAVERMLIMAMRKAGLKLCNQDDGGSGRVGVRLTDDHKEKLCQAGIGHLVSAETRLKISHAGMGRVSSAATRLLLSQKTLSVSHKAALLAATTGRVVSEDQKDRARQKMLGRVLSPEHIQKLSDSHKGFKPTAETLAKRSISLKAAWAKRKASVALEVA